jgi:hypothetical protein
MIGRHAHAQADYDALDRAVRRLVDGVASSAALETPRGAPSTAVASTETAGPETPPAATGQDILFHDFFGAELSPDFEGAFDLKFKNGNGSDGRGKVTIYKRSYKPGTTSVAEDFVDHADWQLDSAKGIIVIDAASGQGIYQFDPDKGLQLKSAPGGFWPVLLRNRSLTASNMGDSGRKEFQR